MGEAARMTANRVVSVVVAIRWAAKDGSRLARRVYSKIWGYSEIWQPLNSSG